MNQGLTFVECLCLCNPCWCEDSDDYLFLSEGQEDEGPFLFQEGELSKPNHIQVSLEEDLTLEPNYDPMKEYYRVFHTLGEKISNHVPSKLQFESVQKDLGRSQGRGYLSLNTHLAHFLLYVCSLRLEDPERLVLIKEYEMYMNLFYLVSMNTDCVSAEKYLKQARGNGRKVDRLLAYERAIFYTHLTSEKNVLIDEYCQFCNTLQK